MPGPRAQAVPRSSASSASSAPYGPAPRRRDTPTPLTPRHTSIIIRTSDLDHSNLVFAGGSRKMQTSRFRSCPRGGSGKRSSASPCPPAQGASPSLYSVHGYTAPCPRRASTTEPTCNRKGKHVSKGGEEPGCVREPVPRDAPPPSLSWMHTQRAASRNRAPRRKCRYIPPPPAEYSIPVARHFLSGAEHGDDARHPCRHP